MSELRIVRFHVMSVKIYQLLNWPALCLLLLIYYIAFITLKLLRFKKGAGGMKMASDFKLPFSCFSSNLGNFSPIRVEMCYI